MRFSKAYLLLFTVLAALLTGCGAGYQMVYDPTTGTYVQAMYNPATGTYVTANGMPLGSSSAYGSGYDTSSAYGSYGSGYDTSSSYGSYGSTYGTSTGYGSTDMYGNTTGYATATPVPTVTPTPKTTSIADQPVLNAYVLRSDQTGLLGYGKVVASVQVENPSNRSLSGTLRVVFTDSGDPTANVQSQRVTLHPLEKQVLTFTASGHINGAEASITTDGATVVPTTGSHSTMTDLN